MSRLTAVVFQIVKKWSKERNPTRVNVKKFEHQPTITLSYWTDGYNWVKLNKDVVSIPKEIKRYESCRFNLFDTYKSVYFKIWCLRFSNNPEEWRTATCTCPSFLKNYLCEHFIGISIRLKYCKPPPEAKTVTVEIGTKRKRGRPSKARKALLLQ